MGLTRTNLIQKVFVSVKVIKINPFLYLGVRTYNKFVYFCSL